MFYHAEYSDAAACVVTYTILWHYIFLPEPNIIHIVTLVCIELCYGMCP
jgi:hypothetical protein